ncbi:MAG: PD-(D/E)XK nuclease family protein [Legionellales bacterium]|nr:PD-(D/E)XK nuclease family protein [Legionellales bacterium]
MNNTLSDLYTQLEDNSVIVTPNRRIAADLLNDYSKYKISNNEISWQTPTILPLEAYINKLWGLPLLDSINNKPLVLTDEQQIIIWEDIIQKSTSNLLFNCLEPARIAKEANDLINHWDLNIEEVEQSYSPDCQNFINWRYEFKSYLEKNNFVESSNLPSKLIPLINNIKKYLPKNIIFAFFDEFTPSILKLKNQLEKNCIVSIHQQPAITGKYYQYRAKTTEQELIDLVCWARNQYLNKKVKIACVVTDLASSRDDIEKIAQEYLHINHNPIPYDISAGSSLKTFPIINIVFKILKISDKLPITLVNEILYTPYIQGAELENVQRITLAQEINSLGILDIELSHLISLAKTEEASYYCPFLSKILEEIYNCNKSDIILTPSLWIRKISDILSIAGWPGDQTINSKEFQAFKKFESIQEKFITLDHIIQEISYNKAITILENFTTRTEFQIQSPKTPIQFLGILEAAGRNFDCIWVANVTSTNWPEGKHPNPFIPINLQLKHNLPHSSYERELEFSKRITNRFINSASTVIFSYSATQNDLKQYPSPLIQEFPIYKKKFSTNNSIYLTYQNPDKFEYYIDNTAPLLSTDEKIRGGSEILRYQSECPFKAFTRFRLNIKPDYQNYYGLNYLQRGILVHYCLEKIWENLQSSEKLIQLSQKDLNSLIYSYVDMAITKNLSHFFVKYHSNLIKLEKDRLIHLIQSWLEFEKERSKFDCVHIEYKRKITIKNIPMEIRLDRIDRINNIYAIIDYKSTIYSGTDWFSDRPDMPQLILYLLSISLPVSAIVLAQIKSGKMLFRGLSDKENIGIPGVSNKISDTIIDWKQQKQKWRITIENLLDDFKNGKVIPEPKYDTSCSSCSFEMLCRINSQEVYNT